MAVGQELDQAKTNKYSGNEQHGAGDMSHSDQTFGGKLTVPLGNQKAQQNEPCEASNEGADDAYRLAHEGIVDPVVGDEGRGHGYPKKEDGRVPKNANETDPEGSVGVKLVFDGIDRGGRGR